MREGEGLAMGNSAAEGRANASSCPRRPAAS